MTPEMVFAGLQPLSPDLVLVFGMLSVLLADVPVASLEDVLRSKEAAGREKDFLVIPAIRAHLRRRTGGR